MSRVSSCEGLGFKCEMQVLKQNEATLNRLSSVMLCSCESCIMCTGGTMCFKGGICKLTGAQ